MYFRNKVLAGIDDESISIEVDDDGVGDGSRAGGGERREEDVAARALNGERRGIEWT